MSGCLADCCPDLETKDKPRISYSEIRGYSEVYPRAKFWHLSNAFCSRNNYSQDSSAVFINKHLIGQQPRDLAYVVYRLV